LYHRYLGDPLEVVLLYSDRTTGHEIVGPDIRRGHKLQLLIPGNTFHTARLAPGGSWFLGASTEWPGVEPPDVELGDVDLLSRSHPEVAETLRTFIG
jgi:predicted cupin superfamily sugar epimerase